MRLSIHACGFVLALIPAMAMPQADGEKEVAADRAFLQKAAQANIAEIEAGKLAQQRSRREDVKQFGQQMEKDHGETLGKLKTLAASKGVSLPDRPDEAHQALAAQLSRAEGSEFDRIYIGNAGVADHKAAKALFQQGAKSRDAEIKAFAAKTLPHIEHHLQMAERLAKTR
ncbi:MAG TPA: DUF4142 domain-containing protein [Burkholderiales bacterium]